MLWGLGAAVYSMDHEVVPRSCRICEWILRSSRDHFGLQQGTNFYFFLSKWSWSSSSPKDVFWDMVRCSLTWSNGFCVVRGERGALVDKPHGFMAEKCCYDKLWWILNGEEKMKTREGKSMVTLGFHLFIFVKTTFLGHMFTTSTHSMFGAWCRSSWSALGVHLGSGPKGFYFIFILFYLRNQAMEVGPWS